MKSRILPALLALAIPLGFAAPADTLFQLAPGQLDVEPSFEACSYYFRPPAHSGSNYVVEFRRVGDEPWQRAFEPVTDTPAGIWKGSLFNLQEDTAWQVRVLTPDGREAIGPLGFRTWSSHPPIARIIDLSTLAPGRDGLVISDQGTAKGWIKYTAPPGWRLEHPYAQDDPRAAAITFRRASHVILENVTIVGGQRHAILVEESDAVRILNCDLSGWGRVGVQQFTNTGTRGKYADATGEIINYDGGIAIDRSARTVVERCYLHDPRHRSNAWAFSHPAGPSAIYVNHAKGGTVLRWNDFVGSDEHRWNDVIEARSNAAADGGLFRDSDISGNYLAFGNDDGVELEGGGMNVRFYRNKIEGTTCGISTGPCFYGPQFIFGNLVANPGDESGLALMFFKNSHRLEQSGKRHFINNTLYGANCSAYGNYGNPGGDARLGYMRNNIFVCNHARLPRDSARRDDFDHDVFFVNDDAGASHTFLAGMKSIGQEPHGLAADPLFVQPGEGDFHLRADSTARGHAAGVSNLTTAGANLGAFADETTEVPFRPLPLTATPRQLNFHAPAASSRLEVTLSVPSTAGAAVPFEIRQNRVFSWFKVTPATGTVAPGETLTLVVTVDQAALRGRPQFKGAFLVRTPTGLSRPISVYAQASFEEDTRPASAPRSVYLEGATLPGMDNLVRDTNAPGVTGGRYVALAGEGRDPDITSRFTLAHPGRYSLLARAAIHRDVMQERTFTLSIDRAAPTPVAVHPSYQWNTGAANFRAVYLHDLGELSAGEHQIRLRLQAGDLNLNELIITDTPAAFFVDEWHREKK